jgi:hypothetical protein
MKTFKLSRALRAALIGMAVIGSAGIARADIKDYQFKLLEPTVVVGKDKIVTVQLVNTKTGKPVPDAVIFATRLDMAPDGMPEMATKIACEPGGGPGSYASRPPSGWKASGSFRLAQRCKAKPARPNLARLRSQAHRTANHCHPACESPAQRRRP